MTDYIIKVPRIELKPMQVMPSVSQMDVSLADVPARRVIDTGLCPVSCFNAWSGVYGGVVRTLNSEDAQVARMPGFGGCLIPDRWHGGSSMRVDDMDARRLARDFHALKQMYFVSENTTADDLFREAYRRVKITWDYKQAHSLLRTYAGSSFVEQRRIIKDKDPGASVSSYRDINNYPLADTFSVDDFASLDAAIIKLILGASPPIRLAAAIDKLIDKDGLLRVSDRYIYMFRLSLDNSGSSSAYRCNYDGENRVDISPVLGHNGKLAAELAEHGEKYCFSTTIDKLLSHAAKQNYRIEFPNTGIAGGKPVPQPLNVRITSHDTITGCGRLRAFKVRGAVSQVSAYNNQKLKEMLAENKLKVSGTKQELLERLAEFAISSSAGFARTYDDLFEGMRFMWAHNTSADDALPVSSKFPEPLILSAYVFKHLRGGAVFDPGYDNYSVDYSDLIHGWLVEGKEIPDYSLIPVDKKTVNIIQRRCV